MTVKEMVETNMMVTDLQVTVRKDGSALLDQLNIGCAEGVEPRYPTMVPKEERYIGTPNMENRKKAKYLPKSINSWDDGKDYWEVKVNRIPDKWLDLVVYSWEVWPASHLGDNPRRYRNGNFHGQRLNITALPSGASLDMPKEKTNENTEDDGQLTIFDMMEGENEHI